jgi:hypothetical protein
MSQINANGQDELFTTGLREVARPAVTQEPAR